MENKMIAKQTVVDQIEVNRNGTIQIRIALELVENGAVLNHKWHRTAIEAGGDVDAQIAAVNAHITSEPMNEQPVSAADIARIKAVQVAI